jgi:SAM-dependent methyltransferase
VTLDPPDAYEAFAHAYDRALGDLFFHTIARVLDKLLLRYPTTEKTHLDVACGTGQVLEFFARREFRSSGLDASAAMLNIARRRESPRLVLGDMRQIGLRGPFSRITCLYDSLNHLLEKEEVAQTFREVRRLMGPASQFWFDVNHPSAYTTVWAADEPFESKGKDYELVMDTAYSRPLRLATALVSGWSIVRGERVQIDETHHQRPYSEREITTLLKGAGLKVREMFRFHPFGTSEGEAVKMFFVAERA